MKITGTKPATFRLVAQCPNQLRYRVPSVLKVLNNLMFMGSCIVRIFQYISKKMQRYTVLLYLKTPPHVSGGTSTHHQERIQLYLQHLVFVRALLLPAASGR